MACFTYGLLMYQYKNEPEGQSFCSFWRMCVTDELTHAETSIRTTSIGLSVIIWIQNYPRQTKAFGFGFVLAHEQANS